jgi:hypothetical protein
MKGTAVLQLYFESVFINDVAFKMGVGGTHL